MYEDIIARVCDADRYDAEERERYTLADLMALAEEVEVA